MCVCMHARVSGSAAPVPVCVAVSFEYRFGGLMRAWDSAPTAESHSETSIMHFINLFGLLTFH